MKLITLNQVKMLKSSKLGYLSAALNLQPFIKLHGIKTCPNAGLCAKTCLAAAGRNRFDEASIARLRRTKLYIDQQDTFYKLLIADIEALIRKANREDYIPTMRLNCLSDLTFEDDNVLGTGKNIFELFPQLQFIDYTKRYVRMFKKLPSNYHLTYSINEKTPSGVVKDIYKRTNLNACMVFSPYIPESAIIDGVQFKVVSGDDTDLRHLDKRGVIIGLKYKLSFDKKTGKAIRPSNNGFITVLEA